MHAFTFEANNITNSVMLPNSIKLPEFHSIPLPEFHYHTWSVLYYKRSTALNCLDSISSPEFHYITRILLCCHNSLSYLNSVTLREWGYLFKFHYLIFVILCNQILLFYSNSLTLLEFCYIKEYYYITRIVLCSQNSVALPKYSYITSKELCLLL